MAVKIERKLPVILFIAFVMLTITAFVFYRNTVSHHDALAQERQSYDVLASLDDTMLQALDMESSVSGFVISGNETYLAPYDRAKPKVGPNIIKLKAAASKNAVKADEIEKLEGAYNGFSSDLAQLITLRKQNGFDTSITTLPNAQRKAFLTQMRSSIEKLKAEELSELRQNELNFDRGLTRTIWILIISSFAGIVALGCANYAVWSEVRQRRAAQTALVNANLDLENRVERRTNELVSVNEQLQRAGNEREALLASEKGARREAEIANRLRDEFMAAVSHELRTPLNSILAWARMMKGGTLDAERSKKALNTIIKNSETQNRLIEDLLDVARLISGKLVLEKGELNLADIVRDSIETVEPAAAAKHIAIEMTDGSGIAERMIHGDRNRLVQVFSNLLTNAIKFSTEGSHVAVSIASRNGEIVTDVRDQGIGISPELLPMVFERFRQDSAAAGKNGGLGLGLAIVRNLVEMHGGSVSAYSEGENKGSTFTVSLPINHRE